MPTRRHLLTASTALAAAALASSAAAQEGLIAKPPASARKNRIAVSTYSFWRFRPDSKLSIEDCIRHSAEMGFDGVEILHRQMDGALPGDKTDLDNAYLQGLKKVAITEGVDLCGLSIHQGFVSPDAEVR